MNEFVIKHGFISKDTSIVQGGFSANTISGGTIYSGSTDLYDIFATPSFVQPGLNIYTGGTANAPTVNVSAATLTSLSATTISGGTLFSGSTNLYSIFSQTDTNDVTRIQPGLNIYTGGTDNLPTVNISAATLTSLSATTISGGTLFSGSTNLYSIFSTPSSVVNNINAGSNIATGGTAISPTINLVASPSINGLTSSGTSQLNTVTAVSISGGTLSGGTIFSGNTNINSLFADKVHVHSQYATLSGATFTGGVIATSLSASTISGDTLFSGSTNLYNIFSQTDTNDITRVQPGSNISTGGTGNLPTINLVASPSLNSVVLSGVSSLGTFSANTISGTTFISGSTNLYNIFTQSNSVVNNINAGSNITTGGTAISPTINLTASPSVNGIISSGASQLNTVTAVSISGGTLSGGTIFSGSTDLYSIFSTTDTNDITRVQPGSNITTGGTGNNPTINLVASPSINGLTFSGSAIGNAFSANTLSGGTIYSGSTNINFLFADKVHVHSQYATLSGATFTGTVNTPSLSATTLSGGTIYSGSTDLYSIFSTTDTNDVTRVQPGLNTYTGGTDNNPTVNISAATLTSLSATTISGGTIFSGSTNLYDIFHKKEGYLLQKAGMVTGSTFAGSPRKATVTFATAFPDNNYAISVSATVNRTWIIESKVAASFVLNSNSNTAFSSGQVYWMATENGEGFR